MRRAVLSRYVLRLFLGRALLTVAGLSAILAVFDVLANADRVVGGGPGVLLPLLTYALLRLPSVASLIIPLGVLLAAMTTFAQLVTSSEAVAMRAAGISVYRLTGVAMLGAALIAVAHFWLANAVVPETAGRLRLWEERGFRGLPPLSTPRRAPTWFAVGHALVHVGHSSLDGHSLYDVTVVRRDADGRMTDFFSAAFGSYEDGLWLFRQVARPGLNGQASQDLSEMRVALPVTPRRFSALSGEPGEFSFAELWRLSNSPDVADRPAYFYDFWLQRKIAQPLGSLVMVLLAAPLALQLARRNRMLLTGFAAVFVGFLFFVAERLLLALGETGLLPATVAAWIPAAVFSILAAWVLLNLEGG
jgi:lipopolysaccharide export system permease protein